MPSDGLKKHYQNLLEVTLKTRTAVTEGNLDDTGKLLVMHHELMRDIKASGNDPGPELKELITRLCHEVDLTRDAIEKQKRNIGQKLSDQAKRKKVIRAYGLNA